MPKTIAIFTKNNVRIKMGVEEGHESLSWPNVVVSPNIDAVLGIPPQYWKQGEDNHILPMDASERVDRDAHIEKNGADNAPEAPKPFIQEVIKVVVPPVVLNPSRRKLAIVAGIMAAAIAYYLYRKFGGL